MNNCLSKVFPYDSILSRRHYFANLIYMCNVLKVLILSLPWDRIIFTKQANPNLASHALKDKINNLFNISVFDKEFIEIRVNVIILNIIISKFNRHIRNDF